MKFIERSVCYRFQVNVNIDVNTDIDLQVLKETFYIYAALYDTVLNCWVGFFVL